MKHSPVPVAPCPYCGAPNDTASHVTGEQGPKPGDVSVCIRCVGVLAYDGELKQRRAGSADWDKLEEEAKQALLNVILAIGLAKARGSN